MHLQILHESLLRSYLDEVPGYLEEAFEQLHDAPISTQNFSFYTSVASVFSSKIEGEQIEIDSYIKHKRDGISFQPDYTKKIDDLYDAYRFAQSNTLNETNVKATHQLLSKNLVSAAWQGAYRTQHMYVTTDEGKIEYVAANAAVVKQEMKKFFADLTILLQTSLTTAEAFYYAAMIHLVFVKIHPFNDGNGRCARLIEKWFLAEKLGEKAWLMQSEKSYYLKHALYYQNLRQLGLEYDELDYLKALPFLLMLPASLQPPA